MKEGFFFVRSHEHRLRRCRFVEEDYSERILRGSRLKNADENETDGTRGWRRVRRTSYCADS